MDINNRHNNYSSNTSTWDHFDMAMETTTPFLNDHHHHQLPYDIIFQNYPPQTHQQPPSCPSHSPIQNDHLQNLNYCNEEKDVVVLEEGDGSEEELGSAKELMYKIAAMQPIDIDPTTLRKPKRRNVRISSDPQSVAARHRRERISERIRILQRLVPGGTKLDTASMLDEAIRYVKFLKKQVIKLQSNDNSIRPGVVGQPVITDWHVLPENVDGSKSFEIQYKPPAPSSGQASEITAAANYYLDQN